MRIKALTVIFFLKPLFYKAFRKAFFYSFPQIDLIRDRGLLRRKREEQEN
jgi:hypothetical protein